MSGGKTNEYDVREDRVFKKFIKDKTNDGVSESTIINYIRAANLYCRAIEKSIEEVISEIKLIQHSKIVDDYIIEYDPNESVIKEYQDTFIDYLEDRGNNNTSINTRLKYIRSILSYLGIKLPRNVKYDVDNESWNALEKKDIQYCFNNSNIHYKAYISFAISTGFRQKDINDLTINSFLKATELEHGYSNLEEFLNEAPQDLKGYWEFKPNKTKRHGVKCKVYNSPESSNYIIQSLKKRVESINKLNKKNGTSLKLEKNDSLFSSQIKKYKGPVSSITVCDHFKKRNDELYEYRKLQLQQDLKEGKIEEDEYENLLKNIPRFRAHGLRKYFCSEIARHAGTTTRAIMEAHANSSLPTDKHYIKVLDEDIERIYNQALPRLTISVDDDLISKNEFEKIIAERDKKHEEEIKEYQEKLDNEREHSKQTLEREREFYENRIKSLEQEYEKAMNAQKEDILKEVDKKIKNSNGYTDDMMLEVINYTIENNITDKFFIHKFNEFIEREAQAGNFDVEKFPEWEKRIKALISLQPKEREMFEQNLQYKESRTKDIDKNYQTNIELFNQITKDFDLDKELLAKLILNIRINTSPEKPMTREEITNRIIKGLSREDDMVTY